MKRYFHAPAPKSQRGVVLLIALIVLVAMTLAGIGMMRSVDTATVVSGNLAFKSATIQSGDQGIATAFQWIGTNSAGTTLNNTDTSQGYFSSRPATEPNWNDASTWANAVSAATDGAGNTTSYLIHRMCTQPDTPYNGTNAGVANQCATSSDASSGTSGSSMGVGASQYQGTPKVYYRITVRITGPRNTYSVVQSLVEMPAS